MTTATKARSTPLKPGMGGKLASKRSKTGNPECSQAMSAWVRARNAGQAVAQGVFAMLGKCRSQARMLRMGQIHASGGDVAKGQVLQARAARGLTQGQRQAMAKELMAKRAASKAAPAPKANPFAPSPDKPFNLLQRSAVGSKGAVNLGKGRTPFMFDMKKGDKPGQMSLMDKVGTVATHPAKHPSGFTSDEAAVMRAFHAHPKSRESAGNFVLIHDVRQASGLSREQFDAAAKTLRQRGILTADSHEGLHKGLPPAVRASGIKEAGSDLQYLSSRDPSAPEHAVFKGADKPKQIARLQASGQSAKIEAIKPVPPKQAMATQRQRTATKLSAAHSARLEQQMPERYGKTGKSYEIGTKHVHFDPERFQYKLAAQGEHGVTDQLKGVKTWNPELAGTVSVWRDPADGKTYVVNGHHRLDLANKLGVDKINVRYLDAPDADTARAKGALVNIAEGRGTAIDAAKFLRKEGLDTEAIKAKGISLKEHTASQGLALAGLPERAFSKVVSGDLSVNRAAIVGGSGLSHTQQDTLLGILDKPKNRGLTDGTVRKIVERAKTSETRTKTTHSLFGADDEEESLYIHRAKLEDSISRNLSADKKLFGLVSRSKAAEALAERGRSQIDTAETGKVSHEAAATMGMFDQLAARHPAVYKPLNKAAERLANGESFKTVERETRDEVTRAIREILSGKADAFAA